MLTWRDITAIYWTGNSYSDACTDYLWSPCCSSSVIRALVSLIYWYIGTCQGIRDAGLNNNATTVPEDPRQSPLQGQVPVCFVADGTAQQPRAPNLLETRAEDAVSHAVSHAMQHVTDGMIETNADVPASSTQYILHSLPLATRVPDKIKAKIWANEYVDLGSLQSNSLGEESYTFKLQNGEEGKPVFTVVPNEKRRTIRNIDQWTAVFQTFVAVYSEKYPQATPGLMKHSSIVRELAFRSANWRFYDENFRKLRQKDPVPWEQIHTELWLRAHSQRGPANDTARAPPTHDAKPSQSFPPGFCFKFHGGQRCYGCNYKHQCFKCGGQHPASQCTHNVKAGGRQEHERQHFSARAVPENTSATPVLDNTKSAANAS